MSFEFLKADLFIAPGNVFAHGCNAYGVMGSGIAKTIKDRFPNVYETYRNHYLEHGLRPADVIPAYMMETEDDPRIMLNLITQIEPGPNARYEFLAESLQRAVDYCAKLGEEHLSIPAIGCGIGGLELIELDAALRDLDTDVMVHVFVP